MKLALRNLGIRAGDGQIVDRAVDRQFADGAAGKEQRLHNKGIGAHGQAAGGQIEQGRVAQVLQRGIAEGGEKEVLDQLVAQLAAAAMAHHDGGIPGQGQGAAPVGEIGGSCFV